MDREDTRDDDRCEQDREYEGARDRHSECRQGVIYRSEYAWYISDEKEHKWSTRPEEVIVDKIDRFTDFLGGFDFFIFQELRQYKLDISTAP